VSWLNPSAENPVAGAVGGTVATGTGKIDAGVTESTNEFIVSPRK
jgi:hypothetical protein